MDYYTIFAIGLLLVLLVLAILRRKNEKELAPAYLSLYENAKFIPTSYYLSAILLLGALSLFVRTYEALRFTISMVLLGVFLFGIVIHRFILERRMKSADLPNEFVRKERLFDIGMSLLTLVFLTVALFQERST